MKGKVSLVEVTEPRTIVSGIKARRTHYPAHYRSRFCNESVFPQLLPIALKISFHLSHAIPAKLFAHRRCESKRDHRFANHSSGRNDSYVRAFEGRFLFLLGIDINRTQRATQGRDWFQVSAHANLFAVCDAAFEAARAVRTANELFRLFAVRDFVVNLRAGQGTGFYPS